MIILGNKKKWHILESTQSNLIDQLLVNRGIDLSSKNSFLNPDFTQLDNPTTLKGMEGTVERLITAQKNNESIGIFGDYDADGITSATLLGFILDKLKLKHFIYIPSREEGYGLNKTGIDKFKKDKVTLLIAVDMGITNKNEIEYAQKIGLDTIVIDHHLVQASKLPPGLVINPRQSDDKYPFKDFSACGLVFKLAQAIYLKYPDLITQKDLKWWLDIVAISTIADMVPLIGENRILAYFGLIVMAKTRLQGLKALYAIAGIDKSKMNPGVVGFKVAPRLNAPGRIVNAQGAYALLNETDSNQALILAKEVEAKNIFRQSQTEKIFAEAKDKIFSNNLDKNKVILVSGQNWSTGLVGIVAGRIMEEFGRPTIVLNEDGNVAKGSARSIEKYHLLEAFEFGKKFLKTFGGHARAGGLSLEIKNIPAFYTALLEFADQKLVDQDLIPKVSIDTVLTEDKINLAMVKDIEKLEPYGFGNSRPVFMLQSQKVTEVKKVGKDGHHLKIKLGYLEGIYFNGSKEDSLMPIENDLIDVIFSLSVNSWMDKESVSLNIIDWRLSNSLKKDIN